MLRLLNAIFLILPLALPTISLAEPPPSQPTTTPVHIDLTTPQSAARTLFTAVSAGDANAIRQVFYAANPAESELADAYASVIAASHHLGDAAREKYGAAGNALSHPGFLGAQDLSRLDLADLKRPDADHATLALPGQRPLSFQRNPADNTWHLVLHSYANSTPDSLPKQVAMLTSLAAAMTDIADRITAGQFATSPDAEQGLQVKLRDVMSASLRTAPPTTQPKSP